MYIKRFMSLTAQNIDLKLLQEYSALQPHHQFQTFRLANQHTSSVDFEVKNLYLRLMGCQLLHKVQITTSSHYSTRCSCHQRSLSVSSTLTLELQTPSLISWTTKGSRCHSHFQMIQVSILQVPMRYYYLHQQISWITSHLHFQSQNDHQTGQHGLWFCLFPNSLE